LNLSSQQNYKGKRITNTTKKVNEDDSSNIQPESNKETLDKQPEKKSSKFNIVNLLFNR